MNKNNNNSASVVAVIFAVLFCLGINVAFIAFFIRSLRFGMMNFPILIPLFAIDAMIIASAVMVSKNKKKKKILQEKGREYVAKFVSFGHRTTNNDVVKYYIEYSWTDELGVDRRGRTGYDYDANQAVAFQLAGTIKIKAVENYSEVLTRPETLIATNKGEKMAMFVKCDYCGTSFEAHANRCPNCGATKQK